MYPELFPFGLGCFNEPRSVPVSFREWATWALNQDSGIVFLPTPQPSISCPLPSRTISDQVNAALLADSPVEFSSAADAFSTGKKKMGTKTANRYSKYRSATTVQEAITLGALHTDLVSDRLALLMRIPSSAGNPPPISGAGDMRHAAHRLFGFHIMNAHLRDISRGSSKAFVREVSGAFNDADISKFLATTDPKKLHTQLLAYTASIPNTPQYFNARRKELLAMIDARGPPTVFGTHSAADSHDPHLHRLIVHWGGLARTAQDPFVPGITAAEAHSRRCTNLANYPTMVAHFWDQKTKLFRERFLGPVLGFTHIWERTEYQSRGSAHGHWLAWHPNAPPDTFLDVIGSAAIAMARGEARREGLSELNNRLAADYATQFASWDPCAVVQVAACMFLSLQQLMLTVYSRRCRTSRVQSTGQS